MNEVKEALASEYEDIILGSSYAYDRYIPNEYWYDKDEYKTNIFVDEDGNKLPYEEALEIAKLSLCITKNDDSTENKNNAIHFTSAALSQIGKETAKLIAEVINDSNIGYFRINNYTIKDNYITKIETNITLDSFIKNIDTNLKYTIIDKKGNTITDKNDLIVTGMKVFVEKESNYTAVVKGDLNGDAIIDISDLGVLVAYIVGNGTLENEYLLAGNLNDDSVVDILDLSIIANLITK